MLPGTRAPARIGGGVYFAFPGNGNAQGLRRTRHICQRRIPRVDVGEMPRRCASGRIAERLRDFLHRSRQLRKRIPMRTIGLSIQNIRAMGGSMFATDQEPPSLIGEPVTTSPLSSAARQSETEAHSTAVGTSAPGLTSATRQSCAPPVGFVEAHDVTLTVGRHADSRSTRDLAEVVRAIDVGCNPRARSGCGFGGDDHVPSTVHRHAQFGRRARYSAEDDWISPFVTVVSIFSSCHSPAPPAGCAEVNASPELSTATQKLSEGQDTPSIRLLPSIFGDMPRRHSARWIG